MSNDKEQPVPDKAEAYFQSNLLNGDEANAGYFLRTGAAREYAKLYHSHQLSELIAKAGDVPSDDEIKIKGGQKWEEANKFYDSTGGVNPSPFSLGFKSASEWMRSQLLPIIASQQEEIERLKKDIQFCVNPPMMPYGIPPEQ